jgi:NAD(P)-dependent dehydrogenase (short-subunit alcohol dehydrogenase family)
MAQAGAKVAIASRRIDQLESVVAQITGSGGTAKAFEIDVTKKKSVAQCFDEITEWSLPTVIINNAGMSINRKLLDQTEEDWDQVIDTNLKGCWLVATEAARHLAAANTPGNIVNIASITGSRSIPLHAYAPAKAAVISITACLAAEWGRSGVRVNAVSPGYTLTEGLQAAIDRGDRNPSDLHAQAAMGRMVRPEEVADAIGFLLSPAASAITGINLPVDCGWLAGSTWQTYGGVPPARTLDGAS